MSSLSRVLLYILPVCLSFLLAGCDVFSSSPVTASKVVGKLSHPWSMVFLPNGEILVSERSGTLRCIRNGKLLPKAVSGLPPVAAQGQGGLLGLALHPQFAINHWLYFAYSAEGEGGYSTALARGRYQDGHLTDVQTLFEATPKVSGGHHFGGRVLFDRTGFVYLTLGDRGERHLAQDLGNHAGSVIRLHDDGRIPANNPFVNVSGAMPEIYTYGHRNIQGAVLNPFNGHIWTHEHGPQGGDEINVLKRGGNYGWPVVTYGEEYGGGVVGDGETDAQGMEQPLHYWVPSIAPSGMTFYTGDRYSGWKGSLLVGSLKFNRLVRLTLVGNKVAAEERLLEDAVGRVRDVQQGPDGYVYVLTDEDEGGLYRLEPNQ